MQTSELLLLVGIVALSILGSFLALGGLAFTQTRRAKRNKGLMSMNIDEVVFLFEGDALINASPAAGSILDTAADSDSALENLLTALKPMFPDVAQRLRDLSDVGNISLLSVDKSSFLVASWRGGQTRIELRSVHDAPTPKNPGPVDVLSQHEELEALRSVASNSSFLAWRQNSTGQITWANDSYLNLTDECGLEKDVRPWPPKNLFNTTGKDSSEPWRCTLHVPGEVSPRWYEVTATSGSRGDLLIATNVDRMVNAELALRDFVQTLTKTFAHLTIGLAIFDKQRKLSLFNPALSSLTDLSPEFLSARPTLAKVLDRLRDKRMIPEPKDYRSWRQSLEYLESAAEKGTYQETWSLPSGQTYRVIGRPHPDGALAFLFEDISAEISAVRRYRVEQELCQSALDHLGEAIAVFSGSGVLTISNGAYDEMWESDKSTSVSEINISETTRLWSSMCHPTPVWGDAREFVAAYGDRAEWQADVAMNDGRSLSCRFVPLVAGATMVRFSMVTSKIESPAAKVSGRPRHDVALSAG